MTCAHSVSDTLPAVCLPSSRPCQLPEGPLGCPAISRDGCIQPGSSSFYAFQATASVFGSPSIDAAGNFVVRAMSISRAEERIVTISAYKTLKARSQDEALRIIALAHLEPEIECE